MNLPWFRLYRELKDDPKIWAIDDESFRVFIESLCWACQTANGGGTGLTLENATMAFRRDVSSALNKLFHFGLLKTTETGEIFVVAWSRRQSRSDVSTPRVRKHRNLRKHNETVPETVSETFHETVTETVACNAVEQNRAEQNRADKRRITSCDSEWIEKLSSNPAYQGINVLQQLERAKVWCDTHGRQCNRRFFVNWLNSSKPIAAQSPPKERTLQL